MSGVNSPALIPRSLLALSQTRRVARPLWLSLIPALALLAPVARADLYEGFDAPAGSNNVVAGSLSDPSGTLATRGNCLQGNSDLLDWESRLGRTIGTSGTDLWVSWLQRRDANRPGFQGLTLWHRVGSSGSGTFFVGDPGAGPGDNTYVIGPAGDDFSVVFSNNPVVPNETAFLVAHFQFRDGKDLATLFVNPTPGVQPTGGVTYSGFDMPITDPVLQLIGTAVSGSRVTHAFDELRVGSTYAVVAPIVPEPAGAFVALAAMGGVMSRRPRGC